MVYHILLVTVPSWGHVRPLLALAVRLAFERDDIVLTILIPPNMLDKGIADIDLQIDSQSVAKRIRLLTIFAPEPTDHGLAALVKFGQAYTEVYKRLVAGEAVTCAVKGTTFDALPAPVAIIMDYFNLAELKATRAVTGDTVPVTAIVASGAGPAVKLYGPESIGGNGDFGARIDTEVARTGRDPIEVGWEVFYAVAGAVKNVSGMPEMYDYESFPQKMTPLAPPFIVARAGYSVIEGAEGLILTTSKTYENSGTLDALQAHRNDAGKATFAIGPLLPLQYGLGQISNRGDDVIKSFMDAKLEKYGEKSVLFMSFGTVLWPESLDYLEEIIECMIEKELPFVFCYAYPTAELPEPLIAKVHASGLGYLSKWAPQQYILTHPATGWYLTHCGWGGVTESLGAGIPMIAWPFMGDQPHNAAHLSENLKVAIELFEVRTGENGLKPLRRNGRAAKGTRAAVREEFLGVIDDMRGAKGAELRATAARLKGEYAKAWNAGGDAKLELQAFLKRFVICD